MKISYSNNKTQKLCEDTNKAIRTLGKDVATKLADLLNAIVAFPCLYDLYNLPQYRLHKLTANRKDQYSFVIDKRYKWRLIIYPLDSDGNLLKAGNNEKEMLIKAVMVEVLEVSEHYDWKRENCQSSWRVY